MSRFIGVLLAFALPAAVSAEEVRRFRFELAAGAMIPSSGVRFDPHQIPVDRLGVDDEPGDGGTYAVGVGYAVHDHVDLMAQFQQYFPDYDPQYYRCSKGPLCQGYIASAHVRFYSAVLTARLHLRPPEARVRPWVTAGLGWYRGEGSLQVGGSTPDGHVVGTSPPEKETADAVGFTVGMGVDFRVVDHVVLGLDTRYHDAPNLFGGFDFVTTLVTLGLVFLSPVVTRGCDGSKYCHRVCHQFP